MACRRTAAAGARRPPACQCTSPASSCCWPRRDRAPWSPAAECGGARISGGHRRITPEEQSLRPWPEAEEDAVAAVFGQQVSVAIAKEAPRAVALREEPLVALIFRRHLQRPDGRLVERETHV